ncbi:hypothetical protein HDU79_008083 [Rhizoclosmatium sp. JEL0117]|nr:hypothetical protein HDU79_008083 [Rhizoclosmatium sp. JEL0117]
MHPTHILQTILLLLATTTTESSAELRITATSLKVSAIDASQSCLTLLQLSETSPLSSFRASLNSLKSAHGPDSHHSLNDAFDSCVQQKWRRILIGRDCLHVDLNDLSKDVVKVVKCGLVGDLDLRAEKVVKELTRSIHPIYEQVESVYAIALCVIHVLARAVALFYCEDDDDDDELEVKEVVVQPVNTQKPILSFTAVRLITLCILPVQAMMAYNTLASTTASMATIPAITLLVFSILFLIESLFLSLLPFTHFLEYYHLFSRIQSISSIFLYAFVPIPFLSLFLDTLLKTTPVNTIPTTLQEYTVFLWFHHKDSLNWAFSTLLVYTSVTIMPEIYRYYTSNVIYQEWINRKYTDAVKRAARKAVKVLAKDRKRQELDVLQQKLVHATEQKE